MFTGSRRVESVQLSSMEYGPSGVVERRYDSADEIAPHPEGATGVQWVDISGLHDLEALRSIGTRFGMHPLALEDVASVGGRPHVTEYEGSLFISLNMLTWTEQEMATAELVSLVLGPNWVLSFQERPGDVFDGVRQRIRGGTARVCSSGPDYLWYALMDAIVDHYFPVLERITQLADGVEERVWSSSAAKADTGLILRLRGEAIEIRRALRPLREEVDSLVRQPPKAIAPSTRPFFSDLRDHVFQLADSLDQVRDTLQAAMEAHVAVVSMRTNEVMKVLTIMASIFIPLTFIVGVYGMNFAFMPELELWWAYPLLWAIMIVIAIIMLLFFRRHDWL
ncbi:MAG: magnesium/cobalt transporter CorA [Gemmatimonadetes bacterium]|nr:magnesium/cobalt transporter CorA [Gemmatimonadota bacterium]MDA1103049.1 magnesium/cobalt transporter CorA [Gemmatimonadota bacterium]